VSGLDQASNVLGLVTLALSLAAVVSLVLRYRAAPDDVRDQILWVTVACIIARMARHESNPDIARRLSISEKTVRNNVSAILTKLCVRDRAEAIAAAHAANLGRPPPSGT
jgi:hypothetical protein